MRKFRLLLTLLLCLTLPAMGWASGVSGSVCSHHHAHAATSEPAQYLTAPDLTAPDLTAHALPASGVAGHHQHEHAGNSATPLGKVCTDYRCACGCGMGTCSACVLFVSTLQPSFLYTGADAVPACDEQSLPGARGTSALRPPIS